MSELNSQLKEYLSRNETNTSSLSAKSLKQWFVKNPKNSENQSNKKSSNWFEEEEDPWIPSLGKRQRIFGFIGCIAMGIFCFCLAGLYVPILLLKARKFALLYTMGSLFIISSFSFLWGPYYHLKHLFSKERLLFTTAYFGTMVLTLYGALWVRSTLLTVICAIFQVIALFWYVMSYIPGGQTGMKFFTKLFTSTISKTANKALPI